MIQGVRFAYSAAEIRHGVFHIAAKLRRRAEHIEQENAKVVADADKPPGAVDPATWKALTEDRRVQLVDKIREQNAKAMRECFVKARLFEMRAERLVMDETYMLDGSEIEEMGLEHPEEITGGGEAQK